MKRHNPKFQTVLTSDCALPMKRLQSYEAKLLMDSITKPSDTSQSIKPAK
jgi:hypothetical protein